MSVLIITELRKVGQGERFVWTNGPAIGSRGGGKAAPQGPWDMGSTQKLVRTDYPGARAPSHQVLGKRRKPFTFSGYWDDRYNFAGYAEAELKRFEALVDRGNSVRFQMGAQVLEGIVEEFDPQWRGSWRVNYAFTVSVEQRPGELSKNRSPAGPLNASERFGDVDVAVTALQEINDTAPASVLAGTLAADVTAGVSNVSTARTGLGATLDQRDLRPSELSTAQLPKLATSFRVVGARAQEICDTLITARSDTELAYRTVASVLDFEAYTRGMRYNARLLMGRSTAGASDVEERSGSNAERFYRPNEGESLYQIARKTLGKAEAWRLIADRNGLQTFTMTGDELLIIPERGQV